jgi:hypothetical protein
MPGRTIPDWRRAGPPPSVLLLVAVALAIGLAIAGLDSRPGWDDTGVTVGLLVLGAGVAAALDGRRPWLWTLLVGAPLPIVEIVGQASPSAAPLIAVLFAAVGASLGILVRRAVGSRTQPT